MSGGSNNSGSDTNQVLVNSHHLLFEEGFSGQLVGFVDGVLEVHAIRRSRLPDHSVGRIASTFGVGSCSTGKSKIDTAFTNSVGITGDVVVVGRNAGALPLGGTGKALDCGSKSKEYKYHEGIVYSHGCTVCYRCFE